METVSIIITIYNGAKWIDSCFKSILGEKNEFYQLEISVYDDASFDGTQQLLVKWKNIFKNENIKLIVQQNDNEKPKGVGYGRNRAIEMSTGQYLCFQDIDDEMLPTRIRRQYMLAATEKNAIIGTKFKRTPLNSTCRFTEWANELTSCQLRLQIYTANGPTVIMPTWFCHRSVYQRIPGGFCELGYGTPEDLIFFYEHIDRGGNILRVNECLLLYRYHAEATTFSVAADTIWNIRMSHLLRNVLVFKPWNEGFTIWNAGKQGRRFYRDLPESIKLSVHGFCDVDKKKINKNYQHFDKTTRKVTHKVPIVHFSTAQAPFIICMKLNLTKGSFELNLKSLNLVEGKDYILFT